MRFKLEQRHTYVLPLDDRIIDDAVNAPKIDLVKIKYTFNFREFDLLSLLHKVVCDIVLNLQNVCSSKTLFSIKNKDHTQSISQYLKLKSNLKHEKESTTAKS